MKKGRHFFLGGRGGASIKMETQIVYNMTAIFFLHRLCWGRWSGGSSFSRNASLLFPIEQKAVDATLA